MAKIGPDISLKKLFGKALYNILFTHIFISDDGVGILEKIKAYVLETDKIDITLDEAMAILFVGKMTTNKESAEYQNITETIKSGVHREVCMPFFIAFCEFLLCFTLQSRSVRIKKSQVLESFHNKR